MDRKLAAQLLDRLVRCRILRVHDAADERQDGDDGDDEDGDLGGANVTMAHAPVVGSLGAGLATARVQLRAAARLEPVELPVRGPG